MVKTGVIAAFVVGVVAGTMLASILSPRVVLASQKDAVEQWEYQIGHFVVKADRSAAIETLAFENIANDKYGSNGWELVGMVAHHSTPDISINYVAYRRRR